MNTSERTTGQIRLTYAAGNVTVDPEDEDRFVLIAQAASKFYQDGRRIDAAIRTFKRELLVPLIEWCIPRADRVQACYLVPPVGHIQGYVLTSSDPYDFDLSRQMSPLLVGLANSGWRINILQFGPMEFEELLSIFNPEEAIAVYGQFVPAPSEGDS